jgi:hypothetical protein
MIWMYDDETLAAYVIGTRRFNQASKISGARIFSQGDDEGTIHVPASELDRAAALIGAKRRRRVSEEQRRRLQQLAADRWAQIRVQQEREQLTAAA